MNILRGINICIHTNLHQNYLEIGGKTSNCCRFRAYKATKKHKKLKQDFDGEYVLYVDGIKVLLQANRVAEYKKKTSPSSRGYLHSEAKKCGFKYHFEQVKSICCDVFIFIGFSRDKIQYRVLSGEELKPFLVEEISILKIFRKKAKE